MAEYVIKFLDYFGLTRERDELRRQVERALVTSDTRDGGTLTYAEYIHEFGLGEDELKRGNLHSAHTRYANLLAHVEAMPESIKLGRGSYEHCLILGQLARCLTAEGLPDAAEQTLRKEIALINKLVEQQLPHARMHRKERGLALSDLANAMMMQDEYSQARDLCEEALNVAKQEGDLHQQGIVLGQLANLAVEQHAYSEARSHFISVLELFRSLDEPAMEAVSWHDLGNLALEQEEWTEAEHCFRESLAITEQLGYAARAAGSCSNLAIVARSSGRPIEAESWYKHALELSEQTDPHGPLQALILDRLADLLKEEVQAGRASKSRLAEARNYAEQALSIQENLDSSVARIWETLGLLAEIAALEEKHETERAYRQREREMYAAFTGNRQSIDQKAGELIVAIAAAARGDKQAREAVEAHLPQLEAMDVEITAATRRIWKGEREWKMLVDNLDNLEALLVLRVLETLAQVDNMDDLEAQLVLRMLKASLKSAEAEVSADQ